MFKKTNWGLLEPRICEKCGIEYTHRNNTEKAFQFKKRKYCSNKCKMASLAVFNSGKKAHNNHQVQVVCRYCGKLRMVAPVFADRPYCNSQCMAEDYKDRLKAEKHWNWQGGITEKKSRDSLYAGYKEWRRLVFQRDN